MDWLINKDQTLTASLHYAPHNLDYVGLNAFDPQPVTPNGDFHESTATIMHRWSLGGGLLQSTLAETSVSSDVMPQSLLAIDDAAADRQFRQLFQPGSAQLQPLRVD